jgi:hypothetical protein
MTAVTQLLNYFESNLETFIWYTESAIAVHIESDGWYVSEPNANSSAMECFCVSNKPENENTKARFNGNIQIQYQLQVSSATGAKVGVIFYNSMGGFPIQTP